MKTNGMDPYVLSKPLAIPADEYKAIIITMNVSKGNLGQVFWITDDDPNASEIRSQRFSIRPGEQVQTYSLSLASHPHWKGNITALRFDMTDAAAVAEIVSFQIIDRIGPKLEVSRIQPSRLFAAPGSPIMLNAVAQNTGDVEGAIQLRLRFKNGSKLDPIESDEKTLILAPGETRETFWELVSQDETCEWMQCDWQALADQNAAQAAEADQVMKGSVGTLVQWNNETQSDKTIALINQDARIDWNRSELGYGVSDWRIQKQGQWRSMAKMNRLSTAHIKRANGQTAIWPVFAQSAALVSDDQIKFQSDWKDEDGKAWRHSMSIESHKKINGLFTIKQTLTSVDGGALLHFSGPELYVGEGSFGDNKDLAVFPGIEYLDQGAVSSSDAVARPPVRDHYMPHPYKATIPLMALSSQGQTIALLWPPEYEWAKGKRSLSPKCSIPNRYQNQPNHLLGLFVPTVPDFVYENQSIAHTPYEMKPGESLSIESAVYLGNEENPASAVDVWLDLHQGGKLPEPAAPPRNYADEIALSRMAYLDSCWNEDAKGWGHCVGWDPISSGGMLALLELDRFLCEDAGQKSILQNRIDLVKEHILNSKGPSGLGDAAGCHVMTVEAGFFWGVMEQKLGEWLAHARQLSRSQNPDGSWGFNPGTPEQKTLGEPGEVVAGTISPKAAFLARLARITANEEAAQSALKGVDALNRHAVPRGSQGWECPLAAADVMVSAHGVSANVDAWRITGTREYLDKAVYWARSGLVFHYLWNIEGRPLQRYATIPIFGTTFYTHTWRGVPVQWCGLVYAYALQYLAQFDETHDWNKVARGIVNSAMLQQMPQGENAGTLPDSYSDWFSEPRPAFINPENIMTNLHELEGNGLAIQTQFVKPPPYASHRISANADIEAFTSLGDSFTVASKPGRLTEILIAPVEQEPSGALMDEAELQKTDQLFGKDNAWRYLPEHKTLLIHARHTKTNHTINLQFNGG